MRNIKLIFLALFIGLSLLWLLAEADDLLAAPYRFLTLRASLLNYTGMLAMGAMSVGMLLAIRPVRLEPLLGGLDKSYRLHKWLGISALGIAVAHWLWAEVPKWLVEWGWLEKLAREAAAAAESAPIAGLAGQLGDVAFYPAAVLMILALIKRLPYRHFFKTHRLLAIVYLVLVFHALVLMKATYWRSPIGPLMALLMLGGSIAAAISLLRKVGHNRRTLGTIESLEYHEDNRVLGVGIQLQGRWEGHEAGQFAFVTFDPAEGPHPFTISSAWNDDGKLRFHIKGIGDYTATLPQTLEVGNPVTLEGPYGRFDFAGPAQRQIWIGGGIGITPFIARMQALAGQPDGRQIDLFYSTAAPDQEFIQRLARLAERAQVRLHVVLSDQDGRLDTDRLCEQVPEWRDAGVWFCGPSAFGQALHQGLRQRGLPNRHFHQELFAMR